MDLGGTRVRVCSIDDLIELKRLAGRHKDLADIEQLSKSRHMTNHPKPDKEPEAFWPVTFAEVEEAQLKSWLAMTPAQRLARAEELLEFARMARQARKV